MGKQTVDLQSSHIDRLQNGLRTILSSVEVRANKAIREMETNLPEDDVDTLNDLLDYLEDELPAYIQSLLQPTTQKKRNRPSKKKRMRMRKRALAGL